VPEVDDNQDRAPSGEHHKPARSSLASKGARVFSFRKAGLRMSEDSPAFQWYAADYLADGKVQLATTAQEGIYIRLLSYCWRELSIPSDPKIARQLCKPDATIEDVEHVLKSFFVEGKDSGQLIHKRLEEERKKQKKNRKAKSEAGRKSGVSRRLKSEHPFNDCSNETGDSVRTKTNSSSSISSSVSTSVPKTDSGGPEAGPAQPNPDDEAVLTFPVQGKPFTWNLTRGKLREFQESFPALDVLRECRQALQWVKENRAKQKTFRGMGAFLLNWLSRSQNSGRGRDPGPGGSRGPAPGGGGNPDPRGNHAARDEFLRQNGIDPDADSSEQGAA